ncbi:Na+/H+ antiporter NhaC family protein [Sinobaca sp. H24]|uniref:Na+/H+ antiporter NhaC family protein n=1 Tax=Sinobaca sp. H24 TaxID=2923376 RepID=UPI0027E36FFE|nr:Na+/H+ antiporter NhaC family protein [Sinobaca sp. H24]
MFAETDVSASLVYGGLIGLAAALILTLTKKPKSSMVGKAGAAGIKAMMPAIYILILAWIIVAVIDELQTGAYLAALIDGSIPLFLLPLLLFIVAGFMAFSTGTSWGTFSLLLPIAGEIAATLDITMMLPFLASVLAGSIFGDHCSPISDTTILSSTGAGSHHIDHVVTQLPYALIAAGASSIGYLVLGVSGSMWLGLLTAVILLVAVVYIMKIILSKSTTASA